MLGGAAGLLLYVGNALFWVHGDHSVTAAGMEWSALGGTVLGLLTGLQGATQLLSVASSETKREASYSFGPYVGGAAVVAVAVAVMAVYFSMRR